MAEKVAPVILTAMELSLSFGEQIILNDASLSIHEGDRIGLVGRNGAGKSTFMNIIGFLDVPSEGHYKFEGNKDTLSQINVAIDGFVYFESSQGM